MTINPNVQPSSAECIIVGGGVIGCSIAMRLATAGMTPLVIDVGPPGGEASSAAPGILSPQIEAEGPGKLLDLGLLSRSLFAEFSQELLDITGVDIRYRPCGALMLADEANSQALMERAHWQEAIGLKLKRFTPADVRQLEPQLGPCASAIYFPAEAQVEAALLARAVELAARIRGARFMRGRVNQILQENGTVTGAMVDGRPIVTRRLVLAAGSWSSLIEGALLPRGVVRPVRGQVAEIEVRPVPLKHVVFMPGGYIVPRSDGRMLLGSTMDEAGYVKDVTVAGLGEILTRAARYLPSIAEAPVSRIWAGLRPATQDGLPFLGATPLAGFYLATGHYRKGILLSAITSRAIAACVLGTPAPVDLSPYAVTRLAKSA